MLSLFNVPNPVVTAVMEFKSLVTLGSDFEQVFATQHHNKSQDVSSELKKDELQLQKNLFCVAGVTPSAPPHVIPFSEEVDI